MTTKRCDWCNNHELLTHYHDTEWGVPLHDDNSLFEFLTLEGAQAGLSWLTVLQRRPQYRQAFADFDPQQVARFTEKRQERLLLNPGLIRNRLKIASVISNARAFLAVQAQFGSFDRYIWEFVDGKPIINYWSTSLENPTSTRQSDQMAKDLKSRGFNFVGTTICYAFMQAVGMVNDHRIDCFRHAQLQHG